MVMRGAKRKGVRYFGPFAHAYAIRETLDLLLRTFPIRTCTNGKLQRHQRLGRPCLYAHIEKCAAPCVEAITAEEYQALVDDLLSFLGGDTAPVVDAARGADAGGRGGAGVRTRGPAPRPARVGAQGHRAPADGGGHGGGPRRHRDRGRRARGIGPDLLRAAGPGGRVAAGWSSTRSRISIRPSPGRPGARTALRRRGAGRRPTRGARAGRCPRTTRCTRSSSSWCGGVAVRVRVPATRREARAARDRHPQRRGGVHAPQAQARVRPQRAGPGPHGAAGGAGAPGGATAHRVLRHLEPAGHRDRGVDDRARRRPAETLRLPPVQDPRTRTARTTSPRWRRRSPAGSGAISTSATKARVRASGSRTRRTCS